MATSTIEISASYYGWGEEVKLDVHQDTYDLTLEEAKELKAELSNAIKALKIRNKENK